MGEGLSCSGRLHGNLRPRTVRPFFFSQFWNDLISWLGEGGVPALGERRLAEKVDHASVFNEVGELSLYETLSSNFSCGELSPHENLAYGKISPHDRFVLHQHRWWCW